MNVEFDKQALVEDLKLNEIPDQTAIDLRVTVFDTDGNLLEGGDCVRILNDPEKTATAPLAEDKNSDESHESEDTRDGNEQ
jgi:hypothetical protein